MISGKVRRVESQQKGEGEREHASKRSRGNRDDDSKERRKNMGEPTRGRKREGKRGKVVAEHRENKKEGNYQPKRK